MDKSFKLFGKNSKVFNKKYIFSSGVPLVVFGKESEKDRFVILKLSDLLKLTKESIKNEIKD